MNPSTQCCSSARSRVPSKGLFLFLLLILCLSLIAFAPGSNAIRETPANQSSQAQESTHLKRLRPQFVAGDVLVRFKKNRGFEGHASIDVPNDDSATPVKRIGQEQVFVNIERFEGSDLVDGLRIARVAPSDTFKAIAALGARDDVLYAEPNYLRHLDLDPNDPQFPQLYGMQRIGAPLVWNTVTGSANVVVAVIDTGVDVVHPDLQANIWTNPAPGSFPPITGDVNGYNFRDNTGTIPAESHATHVAGTIGAVGNNGVGVVGVNWLVRLMSLRFIDAAVNSGSDADAIRAYNYARQMRELWVSSSGTSGANVRAVNASYGGGGYSQAAADAINAMGQSGIVFVAAAGNQSRDNDIFPHYPSSYSLPNMISVTGTTQTDSQIYNYGQRSVLLGAPATGILSTTPGNTFSTFSGTSMATPHVTGAAALLCAANPNLSVNQLRALISFNGDIIPALQGKTLTGRRLNVFKSLQALNENDTIPPGTVGGFQITSQNGRTVNLSFTASGDDAAAGQASLYDISFVDQATSAVVPLTTLAPAASGAPQNVTVKIPYRHLSGTIRLREFDNVGNEGTPATIPVSVPLSFADPYITTLISPAALTTGGTAQGLTFDDRYKENHALPFPFPYFGEVFSTVTIATNGNLYFSPPPKRPNGDADDVPSSISDLSLHKIIAGMWDDLDLRTCFRSDSDVYVVTPDANRVIFRWQGVPFSDSTCPGAPLTDPNSFINFEIELNSSGTIKTRYGTGNVNLFPVVGIAAGEPDPYVIDALTSELTPKTLTNAQSAVFTPRSIVQFSGANFNVTEGTARVDVMLSRSGDTSGPAAVTLATSDTAGSQNCNLPNGKASSRCDYMTSIGTAQFAAGATSATFSVSIIDDSYAEGNETFTVSLLNGSGANLGPPFTATVTISDNGDTSVGNPINVSSFFVRQHYLDFLNREPDTPGLNFWVGEIENCTPKPQCTDVKRINVSAAFFISIEFQQTGYLVERLYKAAYGDATGTSTFGGSHPISVPIVRLEEFLPDTQQIGLGVIVGNPGWETVLENNKQAFIQEFVTRTRFTTANSPALTPLQFVDGLNTKAGNPLTTAERDQLVAELTGGMKTRAQVLRAVAEDQTLYNAEYNRAFVLMQFFGYLRRNPNDLQDTDYTGYDFWLIKLNNFTVPGDDVLVRVQNAEMVKAFILSEEYRRRFGPLSPGMYCWIWTCNEVRGRAS